MIFNQDRDQMRRYFAEVLRKHHERRPLEPLEDLILSVILLHPEYERILEDPEAALGRDYLPEMGETNPFLHMGMHIAIREQLAADRPPGIAEAYRRLTARHGEHEAEHRIMDCLGAALWEAQRTNTAPDEAAYLECVRRMA
jgi:hypothetical protein